MGSCFLRKFDKLKVSLKVQTFVWGIFLPLLRLPFKSFASNCESHPDTYFNSYDRPQLSVMVA